MKSTIRKVALLAISCLLLSCNNEVKIGKTLPQWQEGELDIHFINTARGESTYQILPDGTTFLVDASGSLLAFGVKESDPLPAKPSADLTSGEVIVDYINHFSPEVSKGHINYFLLTHFDSDHVGSIDETVEYHPSGAFQMGSLPYIGTELVFDNMYDRNYPDYNYPTDAKFDLSHNANYLAFTAWATENQGTVVNRWKAGSKSQVVPLHSDQYDVTVRAYSSNCDYWTGEGEETINIAPTKEEFEAMPSEAMPAENVFSNSYILSYGDFDFFLGGDLQYNKRDTYPYMDSEAPIAKVAHKVEVMKANHHGTADTNSDQLLATLCPDAVVFTPWRDVHPRPSSIERILNANPDCAMFSTDMAEKNIPVLGDYLQLIKAQSGHIVVRVDKGGSSYHIYALDDTDQNYTVKAIFGPYKSQQLINK